MNIRENNEDLRAHDICATETELCSIPRFDRVRRTLARRDVTLKREFTVKRELNALPRTLFDRLVLYSLYERGRREI